MDEAVICRYFFMTEPAGYTDMTARGHPAYPAICAASGTFHAHCFANALPDLFGD